MTRIINQTDAIDPARMLAFAATAGLDWQPDQPMPPFTHHLYFWDARRLDQLGRDGHPAVGGEGLIPDFGLPRRMWAGGRLRFHAPLMAGRRAERDSTLISSELKQGRSGSFGLATLRRRISQDGRLCVSEEQDLVYRAEAAGAATPAPRPAPDGPDETTERRFSTIELFRYSALTMNGHRIHYDRDYATGVEGYAGLVVHGPLLAQHLMLMAGPGLQRFSYRAVSPLFDHETAHFCRKGDRLWIVGPDGRLCMTAARNEAAEDRATG